MPPTAGVDPVARPAEEGAVVASAQAVADEVEGAVADEGAVVGASAIAARVCARPLRSARDSASSSRVAARADSMAVVLRMAASAGQGAMAPASHATRSRA